MFAIAIWNETKKELFLARDKFGQKPLYYAFTEKGDFLFASEIKAILAVHRKRLKNQYYFSHTDGKTFFSE